MSKKFQVFGSDDENNSEDLESNFNKALKKKEFLGNKGKVLLDLQTSYGADSRFKIDKKFKDDINISKLPDSIKYAMNKELKSGNDYDYYGDKSKKII